MELLVAIAAASVLAFIVSALWVGLIGDHRPAFLYGNTPGRALVVLFAVPFFLTIGVTSFFAIPIVTFISSLSAEGSKAAEEAFWETWDTVAAVWDWFTFWAPTFITTGLE